MDHLGIDSTAARHALLTGDPERIPALLSRLGGGRQLTARRGLNCHLAALGPLPLLVVATGIGAPATAIVVEELAELGVRAFVRLGTCGGVSRLVRPGQLVVPTGCVRDDGTSRQYIELAFPAVPDFELTAGLIRCLRARGAVLHTGIVHCKDAYYLERPAKQLLPAAAGDRWRTLARAGVIATEMESSALFVLGSLRRLQTASVLINVGKKVDPHAFEAALDSAVAAAREALLAIELPTELAPPVLDGSSYLDLDLTREPGD